jgi:hypothetical protein
VGNQRKKRKALITGILLVLLILVGLRGIRIQSVSEYQQEREEIAQSLGLETPVPSSAVSGQESEETEQKSTKIEKNTEKKGTKTGKTKTEKKAKKETQTSNPTSSSHPSTLKKTDVSGKKKTVTGSKQKKTNHTPAPAKQDSSKDTSTKEQETVTPVPASVTETVVRTAAPVQTPTPATTDGKEKITCYLEIRCDKLVENKSKAEKSIWNYIPEDGTILEKTKVTVERGTTVYGMLSQVCQSEGIALDAQYTPMYHSYYVKGIAHLYEKQAGTRSGWVYQVNGTSPNKGASSFVLSGGDECVWSYTCG